LNPHATFRVMQGMTRTSQAQLGQQSSGQQVGLVSRIAGAALLAVAGGTHLDLYLTGYRTIPTIGPLFLFQVIVAFVLAAAIIVARSWLVSAAGAIFALGTLGGYLLSVWVGLFGFKEVRTTAGILVGLIEVACFVVLAAASLASMPQTASGRMAGLPADQVAARLRAIAPVPGRAAGAVAVVALVLLGTAIATANSSGATASGGSLRVRTIAGVRVLTNAKGFTLYWFGPDTPSASKCNGSCAAYWPPVKGPATLAAGLPGTVSTIRRTNGTVQATYDGHPLYTYVADTAPGQAHGNNLNLNGGVWHEVTVTG
jgi:predicted lipoprotein with Yx(FWY)xxD motif